MSPSPSTRLARQARVVAEVIRLVRRERRMTAAEVAQGMGLAVRTYQDFEAGRGDLDLEKVRLFAMATGSDAVAIALAILFAEPRVARQTMDNKLLTIAWLSFCDLQERVGEQVAAIPPALAFEGQRRVNDDLQAWLRKRSDSTEQWLEREIRRVYEPRTRGESSD